MDDAKDGGHKDHFKNGGCWSKTIWSFLVSAIFGVFLYVCVLLFQKYKAENTRVVCQIKPIESSFPMVTLCNMNPYKASASVRFPDLAHLIEQYDRMTTSSSRQMKEHVGTPNKIVEHRRKRSSPPCKCNFDDPHSATSNDGHHTYVVYPKMATNWSCGFVCCAQSSEGADGRLAQPTKEDVPILKTNGMLDTWILIGMYCSQPDSCKWYDGPKTPIGSSINIESICDGCILASGGSTIGATVLRYYSKGKTSIFSVERLSDKEGPITPLCQVQAASAVSPSVNEKLRTTIGKLTMTTGNASNAQVDSTTNRETEQYLDQSKSDFSDVSTARIFESVQQTTASREVTTTTADLVSSSFTSSAQQNNATTNHAIEQYLDESNIDHLSLSAVARDMVPYIMSPVELGEKIRAGYEAEEVIIRCVFNGYACSYRNFTTIVDPSHGNCYAFNSDGRYGTTRKPGSGGAGLSVSYAVGTCEYLSFIESTGIRVIVSEQDKPIFPDAEGFDACLRSCYQLRVIEKCNCGDPRVPIPDNVTYCPLTNRHCVNEKYEVSGGEQCNCPRECNIDEYDMSITMSKFVSNATSRQSTMRPTDVLDIDVHMASPTALECREEIDYTFELLCWDLVDITGTFTGVTAISVIAAMVEACRWVVANVIRKKKPEDP